MKAIQMRMDLTKLDLIAKLKELVISARATPLNELCRAGDYKTNSELKYPQNKGEHIADTISTLLASQSWIDGETEPELDEILDLAGWLDKDVNHPDVWQELFEKVESL